VGAATKRETLMSLAAELGLDLKQTMAAGDGANDLPMLQEAGSASPFAPSRRSQPHRAGASTTPT
jgi:phosphoserine phosphatase